MTPLSTADGWCSVTSALQSSSLQPPRLAPDAFSCSTHARLFGLKITPDLEAINYLMIVYVVLVIRLFLMILHCYDMQQEVTELADIQRSFCLLVIRCGF